MKRNRSVIFGVLCTAMLLLPLSPALAQSNGKPPTQLTYQGFLTDGNGLPFGTTAPVNKTVIFRIYDALTSGTLKWSSQQVVTVDKGYFSVLLGQGSAVGSEPFNADLTGVFAGASASDRFLELNADGTTIAPRLRFLPAPYAMLAKSATELLDPITGISSVSIASGNIAANGNITTGPAGAILSGTALGASANVGSHSQGTYIEWNKDGSSGMSYFLNQRGGGPGGLVFGAVSTANSISEQMRIDAAGNVGIGTIPGSRLHVAGGDIQLNGGNFLMDNNRIHYAKNAAGGFEQFLIPRYTDNSTHLTYGTGGFNIHNNGGTTTISINDSGNVGIGTTTPAGRLNLSETSGTVPNANTGTLVLDHANAGGSSSIVFRSASNRGSDYGYINYQDNPSGSAAGGESAILTIGSQNDGDDHIALMPSGNVGVGTTAPSAKLDVVGQAMADSFKIRNTTTLILYSVSRGSLFTGSPITGVTQQNPASGNITQSGRQTASSGWWKSTSGLGTLLYTGTFVVPSGETWEVDYTCQYVWSTDDTGGIQWSLDDALADDGVDTGYNLGQTAYMFNQTFILSAGTHVTRVKAIIGAGSGGDSITFPWHTPSHLVVKKYKTN